MIELQIYQSKMELTYNRDNKCATERPDMHHKRTSGELLWLLFYHSEDKYILNEQNIYELLLLVTLCMNILG